MINREIKVLYKREQLKLEYTLFGILRRYAGLSFWFKIVLNLDVVTHAHKSKTPT